jgi:hypothetical protein
MTQPVVQLNVGDTVPLGTILANLHLMGVATDPTTPNMFAATLEAFGDQGVLTVPVLQGPPGPTGQPQFALMFQNDNLSSPASLPNNLTNTSADIGKYWIFETVDSNGNVTGTSAYIWYGTEYRQLPMGSQGPPGPYPVITPVVDLIDSDLTSYVTVSGPASNPQWQLNLAVPTGPPGPAASLSQCPDVNLSTPPTLGQVLGFNGQYTSGGAPIFQPMDIGDIMPRGYTIPESAFQSYTGITGGSQTICTWQAPTQNWPWQPWVTGQIDITGIDLSFTPLLSAEVRIGNPTSGTLVAYGNSNTSGTITLIPHTSSAGAPSAAMSPTNGYALTAAGASTTIYVNLLNTGLATAYAFSAADAQLGVLVLPVGTERALPTAYFGTFGGRVTLSATWHH